MQIETNNLGGSILRNKISLICDALCVASVICFIKMPFIAMAGLIISLAIQRCVLIKTFGDLAASKVVANIYENCLLKLCKGARRQ